MTDQKLVGRQYVNQEDAKCIDCRQPFKFGINIFTKEGHREIGISGTCENCFDSYFENEE